MLKDLERSHDSSHPSKTGTSCLDAERQFYIPHVLQDSAAGGGAGRRPLGTTHASNAFYRWNSFGANPPLFVVPTPAPSVLFTHHHVL